MEDFIMKELLKSILPIKRILRYTDWPWTPQETACIQHFLQCVANAQILVEEKQYEEAPYHEV